jgi:hypothetical protein
MLETLVLFLIVILIVMPVVAILLMGLQRATGSAWPPSALAVAALGITVVLVVAYLFLT